MKAGYGPFRAKLLGKPDCTLMPFCAVCGRRAHDKHHVLPKGAGGVTDAIDAQIPLMRLCGDGNGSGCHGRIHDHTLHVYWEDGHEGEKDGWVFLFTREPMDDLECWELNRASYVAVPGWLEQMRAEEHIFGAR